MYFDNITNPELQYFHGLKVPNFSISLTQIFSSDLFKVEPVTTDNVYRIYPLFYTDKIVSSNSLDKILENKCIICKKNERETYLSFISDENAEIVDFINYGSYYSIGDSLTTAQYNGIVQMYRANTVNVDKFNIEQGIVNGTYADYNFNIDSTTIVDTGILVTDETLTSLGTVTLQNPVFNNSYYLLKLKVYHMTDINITAEVNQDNIVVDTLTIPLEKDIAKNIPFETLDYDYVIGFDAEVEITHTNPVINGVWIDDLILTSDVNVIELGESVELTATLFDNTGTSVAGETVTFYDGNTVIGTDVTDNDGVANYTYTPAIVGDISLTAVSNGLNSNPVVITVEHELILTNLSIDVPLVLIYSDEFRIGGVLTDENSDAIGGADIDLYVGNTKMDTLTTDNNGEVEFTQTPVSTGNHSFQLKYSGDADYYSCESSVVSRTVDKETSVLNLSSPLDNEIDYVDGSVSVAGSLLTDDGDAISNATIYIGVDGSPTDILTTDSNGDFSTDLTISNVGSHTILAVYGGDMNYTNSDESKTVYIVNPSLTLSSDKSVLSFDDTDSCTLTATLSSASPTGQSVELYDASDDSLVGSMTDKGDGTYSYTYQSQGVGDINFYAKYSSFVSETYGIEDYSRKWTLDSSTQLYRPSPTYGSPSITDGVLNGGNCQLTDSFTNNGKWKLKIDIKIDVTGGGVGIRSAKTSNRSFDWFKMNGGGTVGHSNPSSSTWTTKGNVSTFNYNEWQTMIIENNNGTLSITINEVTISDNNWNGRSSSQFYIGIDQWQNTNPSNAHNIKNIRLLYL